jgi:Predicted integral membrane protein
MTTWATVTLLLATLTVGMMAGIFAAFALSVMRGLARTSDATFVEVMRRINVEIINPWFVFCFLGGAIFTLLALFFTVRGYPADAPERGSLGWTIAGLVLYGLSLGVTFFVNVPLNAALAAADPADPTAARKPFEKRWVQFNVVRTLTAVASFVCLAWALHIAGA